MPLGRKLVALALGAGFAPAAVRAQPPVTPVTPRADTAAAARSHSSRQGFEVWAGLARRSPRLGVLGNAPARSLALTAVRWTHRVRDGRTLALDYTADVIPAAFLSPPDTGARGAGGAYPGGSYCTPQQQTCALAALGGPFRAGSAYGAGASPFGLTATFRPRRRVQPTLGATGGFLWFDRREPTAEAARFNFTATAEAGVRLVIASGAGVALTYRFHHLSNAGTARDNPAVASHVLSAGVRWMPGR